MSASIGPRPWLDIKGDQVAICALIHFYVQAGSLSEAGPMLSRLLSYTTRLIFQVDAPSPNLDHFLDSLTASLCGTDDEQVQECRRKVESLIRDSSSFSGLHCFFAMVEKLLLIDETYDEIRNITYTPAERQIYDLSTFGRYLHLCTLTYLDLEDDEFVKVVDNVQGWIDGGGKVKEERTERGDGPSQALKRGDYSLGRAELEGFFDRCPLGPMNRSLQESIFKNAVFHYRTKAYESARAALDEALRLSRGANDLACISACDALLRQVEYEDGTSLKLDLPQRPYSVQELWQVEKEVDLGRPLIDVLKGLCGLFYHDAGRKLKGEESGLAPSSNEFADCCLHQAKVWTDFGVGANSRAFLQTCLNEGELIRADALEELQVKVARLKSDALGDQGRFDGALCTLFDTRLLQSLGMASFTSWQAQIWRLLYRAALQADSIETMDAIESVRSEVVTEVKGYTEKAWNGDRAQIEPNEASFDRREKVTMSQRLLGKLEEARILREEGGKPSFSLTVASQVKRQAEDAHLFRLYRQATMECAESLLGLGNATRAREVMEDIMPQLLVEESVGMRGRGAWIYSQILLTLHRRQPGAEEEVRGILPWLHRSQVAFRQSLSLRELSDVLFVQAQLYEHLHMPSERKEACDEFDRTMAEWQSGKEKEADVLETVKGLIMAVGAHVVAGG